MTRRHAKHIRRPAKHILLSDLYDIVELHIGMDWQSREIFCSDWAQCREEMETRLNEYLRKVSGKNNLTQKPIGRQAPRHSEKGV